MALSLKKWSKFFWVFFFLGSFFFLVVFFVRSPNVTTKQETNFILKKITNQIIDKNKLLSELNNLENRVLGLGNLSVEAIQNEEFKKIIKRVKVISEKLLSLREKKSEEKKKFIGLSFAEGCCHRSMKRHISSAHNKGFDDFYFFKAKHVGNDWIRKHQSILKMKGAGFWSWKAQIILDVMEKYEMSKNVLIFYNDAPTYFRKNIRKYFTTVLDNSGENDIFVCGIFNGGSIEYQYTKRDTFILTGTDFEMYHKSYQVRAGHVMIKNTYFARFFMRVWNMFLNDIRAVGDGENILGKDNIRGFKDHRHDQSILGLLLKRFGLYQFKRREGFTNLGKIASYEKSYSRWPCHLFWGCKSDTIEKYCNNEPGLHGTFYGTFMNNDRLRD